MNGYFFLRHGVDLTTPRAAVTPQSIYRLLLTDGQQASHYPAVHCVHLADINIIIPPATTVGGGITNSKH